MKRKLNFRRRKPDEKGMLTRNIINVVAIAVIASTAITWIGVMEVNKQA